MSTQELVKEFEKVFIVHRNSSSSITFVKIIRIILLFCSLGYLCILILSCILASFQGYTLTANYVSDLGSKQITLFPFIHDIACVLGGCTCIFMNFLTNKRRVVFILQDRFSKSGNFSGFIGGFSYILLGIFSLDRAGPMFIYHSIFAFLSFIGYVFSIFSFSLCITLKKTCLRKVYGVYGLIVPPTFFVLNCIVNNPLLEWFLLISILIYIVPVHIYMLRKLSLVEW